jgi:hypothetical protein
VPICLCSGARVVSTLRYSTAVVYSQASNMFGLFRAWMQKALVVGMLICACLTLALPALTAYSDTPRALTEQSQFLDNNRALGSLLKGCSNSAVGANLLMTCIRDILNILIVLAILILIIRIAAAQLGTVFSAGEKVEGGGPIVATRIAIRDGLIGIVLLGGSVLILNVFNTAITSNIGYQGKVSAQVIQLCREATETGDKAKIKANVAQLKGLLSKANDDEKIYIGGANCSQQLVKTKKLAQKIVFGPRQSPAIFALATRKNEVNAVQAGIRVVPIEDPGSGDDGFSGSQANGGASVGGGPTCGTQYGTCDPGDQCAKVTENPYYDPTVSYVCLPNPSGGGTCGGATNGSCADPNQVCTPGAASTNPAKTPETQARCTNVVTCTVGEVVCGSNGLNQCVLRADNTCSPRCTLDKKCIGSGSIGNATFSCQCVGSKTNADCGAGNEAFDSNGGGCKDSCRPTDQKKGTVYSCQSRPSCGGTTYGQCSDPNQVCLGAPGSPNPSIISYSCGAAPVTPPGSDDLSFALGECESDSDEDTQVHCSVGDLVAAAVASDIAPRVGGAFVPVLKEMNIRNTDNVGARLLLGEITNRLITNSVQKHMGDTSGGSKQIMSVARDIVVNPSGDLQSEKMKETHEKVVKKINTGVASVYAKADRDIEITPYVTGYTVAEVVSPTISYITRDKHLIQTASAIKRVNFDNPLVKGLSYRAFNELSRSFSNDPTGNYVKSNGVPRDMQRILTDIHADFVGSLTGVSLDREKTNLANEATQGAMQVMKALADTDNRIEGSAESENLTTKLAAFAEGAVTGLNACGNDCDGTQPSQRAAEQALQGLAYGAAVALPNQDAYKASVATATALVTTKRPTTDTAVKGAFAVAGATIKKMNQASDPGTLSLAQAALSSVRNAIQASDTNAVGAAQGIYIIQDMFDAPANFDYIKDQAPSFVLQRDLASDAVATLNQAADSTTKSKIVAAAAVQAALAGATYFDKAKDSAQISQFNGVAAAVLARAFEVRKVCDSSVSSTTLAETIDQCKNGLGDIDFITGAVKNANKILELQYVSKADLTKIAGVLNAAVGTVLSDALDSRNVAKEIFVYAEQVLKKSNIGDENKGTELVPLANTMIKLSTKLVKQLKNCEDILNNNPNYPPTSQCQTIATYTLDMLNIAGKFAQKVDGLDTGALAEYTQFFTKTLTATTATGYTFSVAGLATLGGIAEGQKSWSGRGDIASFAAQAMKIGAEDKSVPGTPGFVGVLRLAQGVGAGGNAIGDIGTNLSRILAVLPAGEATEAYSAEVLNSIAGLTYGSVKGGGSMADLLKNQGQYVLRASQQPTILNPYRMIQALSVSGVAQKTPAELPSIDDFAILLARSSGDITDTILGGNKVLFDDLGKNLGSVKWEDISQAANLGSDEVSRSTGLSVAQGISKVMNKADFASISKLNIFTTGSQTAATGLVLALAGLPNNTAGGDIALSMLDALGSVAWKDVATPLVGVLKTCTTTQACIGQLVTTALGKIDSFALAIGLDKNVSQQTLQILTGVRRMVTNLASMDLTALTQQGAEYLFGFLAGVDLSRFLSPELEAGVKKILKDLPTSIFSGSFSLAFLDSYTYVINFAIRDFVLSVPELKKIASFYTQISEWISRASSQALDLIKTVKGILDTLKTYLEALPITVDEKTELKRILGVVKQTIGEIQNAIQSFRAYLIKLDKLITV